MKILFDIGHPAHVHYFKFVIRGLIQNGNSVIVVARQKEITFELLRAYNIKYISRGRGSNNIFGKLIYLFYGTFVIIKTAISREIDLYLSFASPYTAISSLLYRKPNITFDDTEHNIFNHRIYVPFSDAVLTPESFKKNFGSKHIRFKGTMDSAYLHPAYFKTRDVSLPGGTSLQKKKVILRFVSWNAVHDINHKGFSIEKIYSLIDELKEVADIYISSEKNLPNDLNQYLLRIRPEEMHYYLQKADLLIGESGSMATEAAYLGTHSIVLNSASGDFGVFDWFKKYKSFHIAEDFIDVVNTAKSILEKEDLKSEAKKQASSIMKDGINLTDFIVWFVQNYPGSVNKMKQVQGSW